MVNVMPRKSIDVTRTNIIPVYEAKEGDTVLVQLALFKNSAKIDLESQTIRLGARTSKGLIEQIDGFTISKNNLDIELKNSILVPGKIEIDLEFKDASGSMTTASFFITVNQKVLNDEAVEATNEFSTFTRIEENYNNFKNEVNASIASMEDKIDNIDHSAYATKEELNTKADVGSIQTINSHLEDLESEVNELKEGNINIDLSQYATKTELSLKVDKVTGKSLISDSEIERLSTLKNYDDTDIKNTLNSKANKTELHSHTNKTVLDGISSAKVTEWNNKSTFSGNYNDLTNKPTIPTKTSQLTNDSGFITSIPNEYVTETELNNKGYLTQHQDISGKLDKTHNTANDSHNDIRVLINGLTNRLNALADSDDTTLDQLSEIVVYIKNNKSLIDSITTNKINISDIIDNLTTSVTNKPLSAKQGVQLKALIDALTTELNTKANKSDLHSHTNKSVLDGITSVKITEWNNKSTFDGNYNSLTNKPAIPTKISQLTNDSGFITSVPSEYITESELNNKGYLTSIPSEYITETELNTALEQFNPNSLQQVPLYANSIEECTDTTKCYVLPDGFIYAYKETTVEIEPPSSEDPNEPLYTNMFAVDGYNLNKRWSHSSKKYSDQNGHVASGYIPVKVGDVVRIKINKLTTLKLNYDYNRIHFFDSSNNYVSGHYDGAIDNLLKLTDEGDNTFSFVVGYVCKTSGDDSTNYLMPGANNIAKMLIVFNIGYVVFGNASRVLTDEDYVNANIIVTVNQEIKEPSDELPPEGGTQVVWQWSNTGHAFVPNENYDNLIADMKNITDEHSKDIVYLKAIVNSEDSTSGLSDSEKIARIKNWDMPIYENAPVFLLEENKPGWVVSNLTNDKLIEMYDTLMNNNSHYITKEDLGFASDGTTPLYAYHFREPEPHQNGKKGSEKKPVILICSGIHPTERAGEWSMYYALEEITNNPDLDDLRRNVHFIIMPIINPTGVTDSTWGVRNPDGIQTHYQFEVDFNKGNASPGERNYGGEQPLTIPESIVFDNLMKTYKDDLAIVVSCHNNDVDTQRGTDFIWCSCPSNFATNLGYRLADKMSKAWHKKHGTEFEEGVRWANAYALQKASEGSSIFNPTYVRERPEWDWRVGQAGLSGSGGTEYKQALKYGVQGINVEVCSRNMVMDKDWSKTWSSNVMTWGCETYVNFFRIFMAVYDYKDKEQYYKK